MSNKRGEALPVGLYPARLRIVVPVLLGIAFGATLANAAPFAYVPNSESDTVSVIDTATNTVTATVPVGNRPLGVAVAPMAPMPM